eukprot:2189705-Rhodomonas_salina.2
MSSPVLIGTKLLPAGGDTATVGSESASPSSTITCGRSTESWPSTPRCVRSVCCALWLLKRRPFAADPLCDHVGAGLSGAVPQGRKRR